MRWKQQNVVVHFVAPGRGPGLSSSEVLRRARRAAKRWRARGVPEILVVGGNDLPGTSEDGVNVIEWRNDWCSQTDPDDCYDPKQVAITHAHSRVSHPGDAVAELLEADIEINMRNHYLSAAPPDELGLRLERTLTHEFGHVLGLDHNCSATRLSRIMDNAGAERPLCAGEDTQLREAAMFPGLTAPGLPLVSTPTVGELAGLATMYRATWLDA